VKIGNYNEAFNSNINSLLFKLFKFDQFNRMNGLIFTWKAVIIII